MSSLLERGLQISKHTIFGSFTRRAAKLLGKPLQIITVLNETANKLADKDSKDNKFKQLFDTALTLIRLVRSYVAGDYRQIHSSTIISGIAVMLYVASPIDLIPDFIPILGFMDDLALISWFAGKFKTEITHFREWEARTALSSPVQGSTTSQAMA